MKGRVAARGAPRGPPWVRGERKAPKERRRTMTVIPATLGDAEPSKLERESITRPKESTKKLLFPRRRPRRFWTSPLKPLFSVSRRAIFSLWRRLASFKEFTSSSRELRSSFLRLREARADSRFLTKRLWRLRSWSSSSVRRLELLVSLMYSSISTKVIVKSLWRGRVTAVGLTSSCRMYFLRLRLRVSLISQLSLSPFCCCCCCFLPLVLLRRARVVLGAGGGAATGEAGGELGGDSSREEGE
mmetsp:Transcript_29838/g.46179  ORF Transcript_29838/g.46179 Transcript_29838/m.46179 type:complete len:244 (-) Transcript_29838:690-1421(-)